LKYEPTAASYNNRAAAGETIELVELNCTSGKNSLEQIELSSINN
jgi:hypothetical protein